MATISNQGTAEKPAAAEDFAKSWGVHPNYIVTLHSENVGGGEPLEISGSIDETFSISMSSNWSTPLADKSFLPSSGKVAGLLGAFGISTKNKWQTAQVWDAGSPINLSIPFTLIATGRGNKTARQEVADRVRDLLKLVAPKDAVAGLIAPGPTLVGEAFGRKTQLTIGKFLFFDNVIVKGVDAQFDTIIGEEGIPIRCKVQLNIESYFAVFTTDDLDAAFSMKPSPIAAESIRSGIEGMGDSISSFISKMTGG